MRRLRDVLTTRGRSFVAAGTTLVVSGLMLGFSDLTRCGVLLLSLPVVSGLLMRRHSLRLGVERTPRPSRVSIDEPAVVTVALENRGPTKTPLLMAEEQLGYVLGDRPRFVVPPLKSGERCSVNYGIRSTVRGRHRIGPLGVRIRDPFGLTSRVSVVSGSGEVIVLPRIEPLGSGRPPGNGIGAEGAIPHMVALHGEDDVSVREYRDGDDLRRIHWPATARTGDLMVRQEDRPARRRAVILLDARASAHRGKGSASSFEWAVTAAASIAAHLIQQAYAVHLATAETVEDARVALPLEYVQMLDVLAVAQTGRDEELAEVLHAAHPVTGGGGLVVAIVARLTGDQARRVAALRQPGGVGLAMVLDTESFGRGRAPGDQVSSTIEASADILHSAGWSALGVPAGRSVASVWGSLSASAAPAGVR
jgi:uncharacterized protein (DUF58 family)